MCTQNEDMLLQADMLKNKYLSEAGYLNPHYIKTTLISVLKVTIKLFLYNNSRVFIYNI